MSHPHPGLTAPPMLPKGGLRIIALGGLGEIGRNMTVFEIDGQLLVIDSLEGREEDPDVLAELFALDHLATRLRRNGENLLVLGGSAPARGGSEPVPVTDLVRAAVGGLAAAMAGGLPMALQAAGFVPDPTLTTGMVAGALHAVTGLAGGVGYAAVAGLIAIRVGDRPGPVVTALAACGQRSLTCYLLQSVVFVAVLLSSLLAGLVAIRRITRLDPAQAPQLQ